MHSFKNFVKYYFLIVSMQTAYIKAMELHFTSNICAKCYKFGNMVILSILY